MMNKKRYYTKLIAISTLLVSMFASCSDSFFEGEMGARITPDQHYKSYNDVELSYLGCLAHVQDIAENQVLVDGLRSDQMDVTGFADRDMIDINLHELSANNKYFDPSNYYKMIININEIIPHLEDVMEIDRDFDSLAFETFTGNLLTLRTWAYFNLVRLNNEVAIVNEQDPSQTPEYLSKSQAIDRFISELEVFVDEEDDLYRFDFDHYVLLGELNLEKGDFYKAAKYLKFACDGPYFPTRDGMFMVDNGYSRDNWRSIFLNSDMQYTTVRTAIRYSFESGQGNTLEQWMHKDYDPDVKPTDILVDAFKAEIQQNNDPGDLYRGMGVTYDSIPDGDYYINKYSIDTDVPHGADVILYRAADIHLLLAEALNQLGDAESALALLNNGFGGMAERPGDYTKWSNNAGVRGRAYLKPVTAESTNAIEDLIIAERAKELAFEGKRWFDLVRIAERRNDPAYLANKVAAKFKGQANYDDIRNKLLQKENWYLPIPR